ncbi:hypothetical protein O181_015425 [Austropuccinia psidii MF-1]|uniref:Uncharacterized protein n=1 Tax=Austropuccinia psidii MF-1 TaxID=1389203 RepID=A0A9Q3C3X2_9BASI|nr:hypothetical protein [Austropuccinia psidii MF-1]
MAFGNHQRPPAQLQDRIPLKLRGRLFLPQCIPYSRMQEWCIYGIIYHYAPFFSQKSNGDTSRTKLHDSKSSTHLITNFRRRTFQLFSMAISWWLPEDHSRTPSTWPCRSLVVNSHKDYSKGNSQRLSFISIIFKASSTHHSLDNSIGPYR